MTARRMMTTDVGAQLRCRVIRDREQLEKQREGTARGQLELEAVLDHDPRQLPLALETDR